MNKKYQIISVLSLAALITLVVLGIKIVTTSDINFNEETTNHKGTILKRGTVTYISLEGGFFGIISSDDQHYDPLNLPSVYKIDGLRVVFEAKMCHDVVSCHMWGHIIELINIKVDIF